jgi:hypothetical protein
MKQFGNEEEVGNEGEVRSSVHRSMLVFAFDKE